MKNKILIIEDEEPILRLLVEQFQENGFETFEAKDGEKGLKIAYNQKPDLIILDLFMPKMDGAAMLKKLRKSGKWGLGVPVIVATNFVSRASREEVMAYNPIDFIVKTDLRIEDLIKSVQRYLEIPSASTS